MVIGIRIELGADLIFKHRIQFVESPTCWAEIGQNGAGPSSTLA
jgi:hypothetical protein